MKKVTKKEWDNLRYLVERGIYQLDSNANPEDTQFSYCTFCFKPDYTNHREDCRWHEIESTMNKVEKQLDL